MEMEANLQKNKLWILVIYMTILTIINFIKDSLFSLTIQFIFSKKTVFYNIFLIKQQNNSFNVLKIVLHAALVYKILS